MIGGASLPRIFRLKRARGYETNGHPRARALMSRHRTSATLLLVTGAGNADRQIGRFAALGWAGKERNIYMHCSCGRADGPLFFLAVVGEPIQWAELKSSPLLAPEGWVEVSICGWVVCDPCPRSPPYRRARDALVQETAFTIS